MKKANREDIRDKPDSPLKLDSDEIWNLSGNTPELMNERRLRSSMALDGMDISTNDLAYEDDDSDPSD